MKISQRAEDIIKTINQDQKGSKDILEELILATGFEAVSEPVAHGDQLDLLQSTFGMASREEAETSIMEPVNEAIEQVAEEIAREEAGMGEEFPDDELTGIFSYTLGRMQNDGRISLLRSF